MRVRRRLLWSCIMVLLLGTFCTGSTARAQESSPQKPAAAPAAKVPAAPVVVGGKTLFTIRTGLLTFTPEERAKTIAGRIQWLSRQPAEDTRALHTVNEGTFTEIVSGTTVIATVTDADAQAAGRNREELAGEYASTIRSAAETLQKQSSLKSILLAVLYVLLATAVFAFLLKLMDIVFSRFYAKLRSWHGVYIRPIRIQKLELVPAERITVSLLMLARLTRLVLSVLAVYGYVTVVLGFFPWTRRYSASLLHYLLWPVRTVGNGMFGYLPNLLYMAVIFVVAYYVIKLVKFFFAAVGRRTITLPEFYPEWAMPTYKIVRFLIIAFTAVAIFPYLPGSASPAFRGVSIFVGLLLSLGSTSAVANVVAGTVLTYTRAFRVGDRVKIADATGDVTETTLLTTRIRTIKNEDVSIPNALVLGGQVINYSTEASGRGLVLHTSVTIGYDAPWRKVHQLLIGAAMATENVLKDPKPFVLQISLDDFYVNYQLNAFTDQPAAMANTYSELHQNIQDQFNEAGLEIMSQHYTGVRDGNHSTIPTQYLPKSYQAPAFRLPWNGATTQAKDGESVKP